MSTHDDRVQGEQSGARISADGEVTTTPGPATSAEKARPHVDLTDPATTRILFALALLGVLLPLNSLVDRYHQLDFSYYIPHQTWFKGPYHLHASTAFFLMAGLLAIAIYLYAFSFIFQSNRIFERAGTAAYALSLVIPIAYLYVWVFQKFVDATSTLATPIYYIVLIVPSLAIGALVGVIIGRLST